MHLGDNFRKKSVHRLSPSADSAEGRESRMYQGISNALTYHGLRYNYVQDRVRQEMEKGYSKLQAAAIVTKEVGHERVDVIHVYLGDKG